MYITKKHSFKFSEMFQFFFTKKSNQIINFEFFLNNKHQNLWNS